MSIVDIIRMANVPPLRISFRFNFSVCFIRERLVTRAFSDVHVSVLFVSFISEWFQKDNQFASKLQKL